MHFPADLLGSSQLPLAAAALSIHQRAQFRHDALGVDDGMPLKDLGQPIGQVAGQAAAGTLVKFKVEKQLVFPGSIESQSDIICPFIVVPEKGLKKLDGALRWKEGVQFILAEDGFETIRIDTHDHWLSAGPKSALSFWVASEKNRTISVNIIKIYVYPNIISKNQVPTPMIGYSPMLHKKDGKRNEKRRGIKIISIGIYELEVKVSKKTFLR
jgi:hypothetical protein